MLPHDIQALMAKILFFIFATCLLCLPKIQASGWESSLTLKKDAQIAGRNLRAEKTPESDLVPLLAGP